MNVFSIGHATAMPTVTPTAELGSRFHYDCLVKFGWIESTALMAAGLYYMIEVATT